jgi:hypothetical protein
MDTWLNFDQALFGFSRRNSSRQKKTRDGLNVTTG